MTSPVHKEVGCWLTWRTSWKWLPRLHLSCPHHPPTSCRVFTSSSSHQLTNSSTSPPAQQPRARGWQKLRDRAASGCIKLWTWTKILSPTVYILYFVENLRFPDTEEKQLAFVHMKSKDGLILSRKQHIAPHQILFSTHSHDSLALQLTLMISIPMITWRTCH